MVARLGFSRFVRLFSQNGRLDVHFWRPRWPIVVNRIPVSGETTKIGPLGWLNVGSCVEDFFPNAEIHAILAGDQGTIQYGVKRYGVIAVRLVCVTGNKLSLPLRWLKYRSREKEGKLQRSI